jgi:Methylase involved in ubiquinone/menaquinone biosynthesis
MQCILDLGCGNGDSWQKLGLKLDNCRIIGIDTSRDRVQEANLKYRKQGWEYLCARGEEIPLPAGSVDGIFCNVALPYMHIPRTLDELHRVLVPGGWLKASLHAPRFTLGEFRKALPKPKATLFRMFVLVNGMVFHCSGKVIALGKVAESCQTKTGMRIALREAGFTNVSFRREGLKFFVDARRDDAAEGSRVSVRLHRISADVKSQKVVPATVVESPKSEVQSR